MITFNPNVNTTASSNRVQKQNFCAIVPKHYNAAKEAVRNHITYSSPVIEIQDAYRYKHISKQDAHDTLDAIRVIYPEFMHKVVDSTKQWLNEYAFRK